MLSCVPQIWHCAMCAWSGDIPTYYVRQHFIQERLGNSTTIYSIPELAPRDPIPHPTCPECGEHRFYIEDIKE